MPKYKCDENFTESYMSVKKYLTLNGLTYFLNKIKTYLTSSTYLNSIGIFPNTDNSVDLGDSSENIKMIYTKGITINGTQFLPSDYATLSGLSAVATSGSYNDLSDKPIIPDVSNYYTKAEVDALISNAGISPSTNTLFIGEPYSLVNPAETNLGNYEEVSND